jgi:hypothetical protein
VPSRKAIAPPRKFLLLFGGRVLDCGPIAKTAGFSLVVNDFSARAEGLHGVNQPRVHGIAM